MAPAAWMRHRSISQLRETAGAATRFAPDSSLEEAVCCELVSEMELGKSGFWDPTGSWTLFPRGSAYLSDCYYEYF
jgi:hypothetical protein